MTNRVSAVLEAAASRAMNSRSAPLGATLVPGGVNFSIFSRYASAVELLFFDREDDPRPARVIPIDPATNRTYHYWHTFVPDVQAGQIYGYRVNGSFDPAQRNPLRSRQSPPRPVRPRCACSQELQPRGGACRGRQRRHRHEERRGRSPRLRLGGRCAPGPPLLPHHHLRGARARLHSPSQLRIAGEQTWNVCRPDRKDSLFDRSSASPPWN